MCTYRRRLGNNQIKELPTGVFDKLAELRVLYGSVDWGGVLRVCVGGGGGR